MARSARQSCVVHASSVYLAHRFGEPGLVSPPKVTCRNRIQVQGAGRGA